MLFTLKKKIFLPSVDKPRICRSAAKLTLFDQGQWVKLLISPLFKILQKNKSSLGSTSRSRWHYKLLLINREQVWNRSPTSCSTREMGGSAPLFWDVGSEGGNSGGNWRRGLCRSFIFKGFNKDINFLPTFIYLHLYLYLYAIFILLLFFYFILS